MFSDRKRHHETLFSTKSQREFYVSKLRILITNNTLDSRAGTELYARDIALGLLRRGYAPVAYSTQLGELAGELRAVRIPIMDDLSALSAPPTIDNG